MAERTYDPNCVIPIFDGAEESQSRYLGTGVLISPTRVLTCNHVIVEKDSHRRPTSKLHQNFSVRDPQHRPIPCQPGASQAGPAGGQTPDLAVLYLARPLQALAPPLLTQITPDLWPRIAGATANVSALGYTNDHPNVTLKSYTVSQHTTQGFNLDSGELVDAQMSGGWPSGCSGGPILLEIDNHCYWLGVAYLGGSQASSSRMITAQIIASFLQSHDEPFIEASARTVLRIPRSKRRSFDHLFHRARPFRDRTILLQQLKDAVDKNPGKVIVVVGRSGKGKTRLIIELLTAEWSDATPRPSYFFFERFGGSNSPENCFRALVEDLSEIHQLPQAELRQLSCDDLLIRLRLVMDHVTHSRLTNPQLVVIDALDEADSGTAVPTVFERIPTPIPPGLVFLVSSRPHQSLDFLLQREDCICIDLEDDRWLADDIAESEIYVRETLPHKQMTDSMVKSLARAASGNFLVLERACARLQHVDVTTSETALDELVTNLASVGQDRRLAHLYRADWKHRLRTATGPTHDLLYDTAGVLAAARAPLSGRAIMESTAMSPASWDQCHGILRDFIATKVNPTETPPLRTYRFYHETIRTYMNSVMDQETADSRLADFCLAWDQHHRPYDREYAIKYGPAHLIACGRNEEATTMLVDLKYLESALALDVPYEVLGYWRDARGDGPIAPEYDEVLSDARRRASNETFVGYLRCVGRLACLNAEYGTAKATLMEAMDIALKRADSADIGDAGCLRDLALTHMYLAEYDQAERSLQQSLEIQQALLGDSHVEIAQSLEDLARIMMRLCAWDRVPPLLEKARQIRIDVHGADHPAVATASLMLGTVCFTRGRYRQAIELQSRAVEIQKGFLGESDVRVGTTLEGLGASYGWYGRVDEAEKTLRRSIEIREKAVGPDHSFTGSGHAKLARMLDMAGKTEPAGKAYLQAMGIWEKALGFTSNWTSDLYFDYVKMLQGVGHEEDIQMLCDRAVDGWKTSLQEGVIGKDVDIRELPFAVQANLPADDFRVRVALKTFGALLGALGEYRIAVEAFERLFRIYDSMDEVMSFFADTYRRCADVLVLDGHWTEAREKYEQAGAIVCQTLDSAHPKRAEVYLSMSKALGRHDKGEALSYLHSALEIWRVSVEPGHHDIDLALAWFKELSDLYRES
jgi:tetratricopeptide (TPR) repeat protein